MQSYRNTFTSYPDTELYLVSILDIDSMITMRQINKTMHNIIQNNIIYKQLLSYINIIKKIDIFKISSDENTFKLVEHLNIFEYMCTNNYIELIIYLYDQGYIFSNIDSGLKIAAENNHDKILEWHALNYTLNNPKYLKLHCNISHKYSYLHAWNNNNYYNSKILAWINAVSYCIFAENINEGCRRMSNYTFQ